MAKKTARRAPARATARTTRAGPESAFPFADIEHVVVLMLENRSFDHTLGALALEGKVVDGIDLAARRFNLDKARAKWHVGPMSAGRARVFDRDPPHDSDSVTTQMKAYTNINMMGFVEAYEREHGSRKGHGDVMNFLSRGDLPITYALADEFTTCQRWFSPVPTQTIPNRLYSVAGHAGEMRDQGTFDYIFGVEIDTIFDKLDDRDWAIYAGALPLAMMVKSLRSKLMRKEGQLRKLERFRSDAEQGRLRKLTWIEPTYMWADSPLLNPWFPEPNDDHPPSDTLRGQALIRDVYNALSANPDSWAKTVLVITYDEHGGFYDHVLPPRIWPDEIQSDGFSRRGPRVPALVVSPFAKAGAIVGGPDDIYDHCSILKFLCEWLHVAPFSSRIASPRIKSLSHLLTRTRRVDIPLLPALPEIPEAVALEAAAPPPLELVADHLRIAKTDTAVMLDDMRLQLEREYPEQFAKRFPEFVGLPPLRSERRAPTRRPRPKPLPEAQALEPVDREELRRHQFALTELALENERLRAHLREERTRTPTEVAVSEPELVTELEAEEVALEKLVTPRIDPDYTNREGYDVTYLGARLPVPMVTSGTPVAVMEDGESLIPYEHFSVVVHKRRRLALFTASNVDGRATSTKPTRGDYGRKGLSGLGKSDQEKWLTDPRIPEQHQLPDVFYTKDNKAFDKGHIVRREDVCWGTTRAQVVRANGDTFHTTNCSPQVADFNQSSRRGVWGQLENYIMSQARSDRYSVFAGPVLANDDAWFEGRDERGTVRVQIPQRYWKVVVAKKGRTLQAFAFVLEQDLSDVDVSTEEFNVDETWRPYLVSVSALETDLRMVRFPAVVRQADQHGTEAGTDLVEAVGVEARSANRRRRGRG